MARPRTHSGADGPKEPHSVSLKGKPAQELLRIIADAE